MEGIRDADVRDAERCLELARELVSGLASQRGGVLLLADAGLAADSALGIESVRDVARGS